MKLSFLCESITVMSIAAIDGKMVQITDISILKEIMFDIEINGISTNSKNISHNYMFICIAGTKSDGNDYICEAIDKGARVIVTDNMKKALYECSKKEYGCLIIETDSTRLSSAFLYDTWYGNPSKKMRFIAVTGTNGKTSVTYMLKSIFEAALYKCGMIGTVNCYSGARKLVYNNNDPSAAMTTPDPDQLYAMLKEMADDGAEYIFLEATSHALALDKLAPIKFDIGVFTNLTPDHLDFHKTMENYMNAKLRLFDNCKTAIINMDDKYSDMIKHIILDRTKGNCRIITCSVKYNYGYYHAENIISHGIGGCEYRLVSDKVIMQIKSHIPGAFTVINSLQAAVAALECGISPAKVHDGLYSLNGIDGRIERVRLCAGAEFSLFIDYAHTPDALENLLETVHGFRKSGQRIVLLFGCGGDRDKSKRPVMGRIASELADKIIITSDNCRTENPETIIKEIVSGINENSDYITITDRSEAIDTVIRTAEKGDIILLAGKGHEEYEITNNGKHLFSERKIAVLSALRYYSAGNMNTF